MATGSKTCRLCYRLLPDSHFSVSPSRCDSCIDLQLQKKREKEAALRAKEEGLSRPRIEFDLSSRPFEKVRKYLPFL